MLRLPTNGAEGGGGCLGVSLDHAVLHGDPADPRVAWIDTPDGRQEVFFPLGFVARFTPKLEVINARGRGVAKDGDAIDGGCWTVDDGPVVILSDPRFLLPAGSSAVELPTYGPGDDYPAALISGTVELKGWCVVLRNTTDHLLVWPSGTTASLDSGALAITSAAGPTLREHQQVSIGGGEFSEADFPRPISGLADACHGYLFWLAAPAWN